MSITTSVRLIVEATSRYTVATPITLLLVVLPVARVEFVATMSLSSETIAEPVDFVYSAPASPPAIVELSMLIFRIP